MDRQKKMDLVNISFFLIGKYLIENLFEDENDLAA
jgi:hypothetical protein